MNYKLNQLVEVDLGIFGGFGHGRTGEIVGIDNRSNEYIVKLYDLNRKYRFKEKELKVLN